MNGCKGMNCGCTDGVSHSLECQAEHAACIAGGVFVKAAKPETQVERSELIAQLKHWSMRDTFATKKSKDLMWQAAALLSAGPARVEPLTEAQLDSLIAYNRAGPWNLARLVEKAHGIGIGKDQA